MSFITSAAGLSKAEKICRLSNVKKRLIMGEKRVTKAITTMSPPVTVLIVAADSKATELQLPILKLATRTEVGNIVGYPSASACVLSFPGDQDLLAELVHLG